MPHFKPNGYNSASPYLIVGRADATIEFLKQVFDGRPLRRIEREDGSVMHAEVQLDDTVIMMGEAMENWPAVSAHVHVYVPDVDATYQKALAAGGTSIMEPAQRSEGDDKRGGVLDPNGISWWIATQPG
ncbi:VOC family protein [Bremerella sp. JC770]|uniref:VOC family protein n=1 Tax=Bremerella sp. JC770 TaxID=3232137 RepID=UPI0034589F3C